MATQNWQIGTTIKANENLSSHQYRAIALDDGLLANNGVEASGILLNKPKSGEFLTLGWIGEFKFAAGDTISAGNFLKAVTSGYFTVADSGYTAVGRCKVDVTSGSYGTGLFNFAAPSYITSL